LGMRGFYKGASVRYTLDPELKASGARNTCSNYQGATASHAEPSENPLVAVGTPVSEEGFSKMPIFARVRCVGHLR